VDVPLLITAVEGFPNFDKIKIMEILNEVGD
jgi:hypothetical protein